MQTGVPSYACLVDAFTNHMSFMPIAGRFVPTMLFNKKSERPSLITLMISLSTVFFLAKEDV
jgi:hypothetical protein